MYSWVVTSKLSRLCRVNEVSYIYANEQKKPVGAGTPAAVIHQERADG